LKSALLGKISFWLIVIGSLALLTPQPAWPEWLARMILSAGIALGVTTLGVLLWRKRGGNGNE
jgi:Na+/proline symporter